MNVLLILFLVFVFALLAIWLLPSWKVLADQLGSMFSRAAPGPANPPESHPAPPKSPGKHSPGEALTPGHKAKRHTVLPHQARGR